MNDKDRVRYEACKRSPQFGKDYKSQIPNGSMLETAFADLDTKVNETATGEQSAAIGESGQQFNIKRVSREHLFDLLQTPADAARAAEPENPERFRFNRNLPDAELLAKANSFTSCDAAEEALLITYMAPASWKSDLAAESGQKIDEAMQLKRTIHNMIKIVFKGNVPALSRLALRLDGRKAAKWPDTATAPGRLELKGLRSRKSQA